MDGKLRLAQEIASRVKADELIGIGTGSTVDATLEALQQRIKKEGLRVRAITTSYQSAWRCKEVGIEVLSSLGREEPVWGFDGADAIDSNLWLIKGKGGAMLQEKIVAARCRHFVVAADESKFTQNLAGAAPIPVEVIPEALAVAERELKKLGATSVVVRPAGTGKHGPVLTEAGNIVLDTQFKAIDVGLEGRMKQIVGVVDTGLFIDYAHEVLLGSVTGIRVLKRA